MTSGGDYANPTGITHFIADLPLPEQHASPARWLGAGGPQTRWRGLVRHARAEHPQQAGCLTV
ncbi:hypothetical protein [Actinacidiphila reveromycinica]|uniref:hypothetical protein n=1 Tax=Actinacidiphila reveromycinica TaxID=659352 RepID=UPI00192264C1|nr:hypothetical protein [Streptomyces sp. SN-593]